MRRGAQRLTVRFVATVVVPCCLAVAFAPWPSAVAAQESGESTRSSPKDATPYVRPAVPEEYGLVHPLFVLPPSLFIVDPVVNNTDPTLNATDTENDGETSIAVNPANPKEIVITTFSGPWEIDPPTNAPIWYTSDGGTTWTKSFTVPPPPGIPADDCPCDQTIDFGRGNRLSGAFLTFSPSNAYSGTTTDPTDTAAWNWLAPGGVTQMVNNNVPSSFGNADQPWLLVNRDPFNKQQDNVYVAYDNFGTVDGIEMRVAVSRGADPPNFDLDRQTGTATRGVNPGHRLAVDAHRGTVYSLFQHCVETCLSQVDPKTINYVLNRSTDGGQTWGLNGSPSGIVVATAQSTQPRPKFGTVNALIGGVLHAAVDQKSGDVYYAYGNRDPETGKSRLAVRRISRTPQLFVDTVQVGPERFLTGQVHAAIPSVAVAANGTIGVFYYTFDGFSGSGFPIFTAHLALSGDHGATFTDQTLLTFLSPAQDNGDLRQRVLGDYMQMKALGQCFYGSFTGNGISFGRPFANNDPIFFRACVGPNLVETLPAEPPARAAPGRFLLVKDTVTNEGSGAAGASRTGYYLSLDPVRSPGDTALFGSRGVPPLAPGASSTGSTVAIIPVQTPPGTYYLLTCADVRGDVVENEETDNCTASGGQVTIR